MCRPFPSSALALMQPALSRKPGVWQLRLNCLVTFAFLSIVSTIHTLAGPAPEPARAAVFSDSLPGFDQTLARDISHQVQAAGYIAEFIDTTVLTNQTRSEKRRVGKECRSRGSP